MFPNRTALTLAAAFAQLPDRICSILTISISAEDSFLMELPTAILSFTAAFLSALTAWFAFSDIVEVKFIVKLDDDKLKLILKKPIS